MFVSEKLIPVTREVRNWENENNKVMTFMTNDVWWRNDELNQNNIVTPLNGRDLYNYSSGTSNLITIIMFSSFEKIYNSRFLYIVSFLQWYVDI